ncbi:NAD(P)/FAD-dependent oxidoreductase [Actinophytocola sp.]|uniref:NAD(P)/FAD-dependent oxidoreductase n=1 Tax=Actinophytocola sp. TaxID=1872138 RepID=UPI002D80CAB0|nr:FAD-dependent oxidoreductase [Actinophytocola sp.]HET9140517.1 FAD-dependent oxidoreductase [Actinophytocola sp.]
MPKSERIVIVGAGAAGVRAAERLREQNFDGELVIVSEEPYRPYHRPALCKQILTGQLRPKDIVLPVHTELDAIWRYGARATRLDPDEHIVTLPGDERIRYDGLVIATGVQARHLPGAPRQDPRVQVLRTMADSAAVRRAIAHGRGGVAVIGGGFVACEVAAAAVDLNRQATIITREDRLLDRVPGVEFGEAVHDLHESNGVQVITQVSVRDWVSQADGVAVYLTDGRVVVASCVVLGVGSVPTVDWLRGSGLILDDGIMCDPTCHAVGANDIVVAGDVARWPNLRFDTMPRRVEHWTHAIEMGRAAADNLLAGHAAAQPFTPVPRFWSEQHGVRIQAAGLPALAQDTVELAGEATIGHRVTGYVSDGSLVGVLAWDSPRGMLRWTDELEHQTGQAMRRRMAGEPERGVRRTYHEFAETPPMQQPAMFADTQEFPRPVFAEPETLVARPVAPPPFRPAPPVMPPMPVAQPYIPVAPPVPVAQHAPVAQYVPVEQPEPVAEQDYSEPEFVELALPEEFEIPDVVPDMSKLGPAELSLPNIPVPAELLAIGAAMDGMGSGGQRMHPMHPAQANMDPAETSVFGMPPVQSHAPDLRDLFR